MSRLVIVLTVMEREEGDRSYPSQSLYPAKGPTVGGGTDDPRREHTRDAAARHAACPGTAQRHVGLSGGRHLAHRVLSVAGAARALPSRWPASSTPPRPAGPTSAARAPRRAAAPGRGAGLADLGLWARRRSAGPRVQDSCSPGDRPTLPVTDGSAAPPGSPRPARAPQRGHLRAAHRTDPGGSSPAPAAPGAAT